MKRIVSMIMAAMLFMSMAVSAQILIKVDLPDTLAGKSYVQNIVRQAIKDAGIVANPPKPPIVVLPGCAAGPEITGITDKSVSGVKVQFHGFNVFRVVVDIYSGVGTHVYSDTISPNSSQLTINFKKLLAPGTYKLFLRGVSCAGEDSDSFVIPSTGTGDVVKPVPDPVVVERPDQIELALYFSAGGSGELKARAIGTKPYKYTAYNEGNGIIYEITSNDQEVAIPDAVVAALGNQKIKVTVTDSQNKSASRSASKVVRDRERILHAFHSISNGNVNNHLEAINQGDGPDERMTATAVIFGEINTTAQLNAFLTSKYNPTGENFEFDKVLALAESKTFAKRLKIGVHLGRVNLSSDFYGYEALIMRPGGGIPAHMQGFLTTMIPSPAHPATRAYAKKVLIGLAGRYEDKFLNGTAAWLGMILGNNGEAEYPTDYKDVNSRDEGRSKGDFNPAMVSIFKSRYPQYASKSDSEIGDAPWGSPLNLDWREHHAVVYAEFEEEVFEAVYAVYPRLRDCQFEVFDIGSAVDDLSPFRQTQNVRRRVRKETGMIKMNDNPYSGSKMRYVADHAKSLGLINGMCTVAFEPSPQNTNFSDEGVRSDILVEADEMEPRGISWSFFDHGRGNTTALLSRSQFGHGKLRPANDQFKKINGDVTLLRLTREISDVFKTGAVGGWENSHTAFRIMHGLNFVDTLSSDNLSQNMVNGFK